MPITPVGIIPESVGDPIKAHRLSLRECPCAIYSIEVKDRMANTECRGWGARWESRSRWHRGVKNLPACLPPPAKFISVSARLKLSRVTRNRSAGRRLRGGLHLRHCGVVGDSEQQAAADLSAKIFHGFTLFFTGVRCTSMMTIATAPSSLSAAATSAS
jgi:hypothetical protein